MTAAMKPVSEIEMAYQILQQRGQVVYFRDLISDALAKTGRPVHSMAQAIAEVHTQINMDSRFVHMGKGMWGLVDWSPQSMQQRSAEDYEGRSLAATARREKLFEEIQQEYIEAPVETAEQE